MYCSGCGVQIQDELNFCNRCGSKMPKGGSSSVAENLSQSVGYIGGFGLFGFIFAVLAMVKTGADPNIIVPIAFFYLATLFGICYLLIRQTSALSQTRKPADPELSTPSQPAYLKPATTAQLGEQRDAGIGSVTEQTTRTLNEVLIERK